jgi:hypothetical protein
MTSLLAAVLLAAAAPEGAPPPSALATAREARALCEAVTPTERRTLEGTVVDRGEAEARWEEDRDRALEGRYRAVVPGESLRFGAYAPEEAVLSLYRHALPAAADGALRLRFVEDPGLPVGADPAAVRRILLAQSEKKLQLDVTFVLAEEEAPCFHVPGARAWTVSAEPVSWRYVADGTVLARGGQDADRPLVSAKEGARPRVQVGRAASDDGGDDEAAELREAVQGRSADLQRCYATALAGDPWLDGVLVADVDRRGDRVRIAADSIGSAELASCVRNALAGLDVELARGFVPIEFALDAPTASR